MFVLRHPNLFYVHKLPRFSEQGVDVPMNEVDFLRQRLAEEQANVLRANEAREEAETRSRLAERERDIYKILARTLRSRLNSSLPDRNDTDDIIEEATVEMILGERDSSSTPGLGRMLRLVAEGRNEEEMVEDGDEDFEFSDEENDEDMSEGTEDDDEDEDDEYLSIASDNQNDIVDSHSRMSNDVRSQSRTVSIAEENL